MTDLLAPFVALVVFVIVFEIVYQYGCKKLGIGE